MIVIILFFSFIFTSFLYLIYLPFKKKLKKSDKLTNKLNRKINWIFIILFCLIGIILYILKDYRTSSKDRLESISDVKIPKGFKVIKDEYQDMQQDYCILYNIKLDGDAISQMKLSIKTSKFYNNNSFHNNAWIEKDFVVVDSVKGLWCKSPKGFDFNRQDRSTSYQIEFDTITNNLKYRECAD